VLHAEHADRGDELPGLLAPIRRLISRAACALRCARLRNSPATTAKPRPWSPARAASTAAFSVRMLVWNAMASIVPMMSAIFFELALISSIVETTWPTTSPPRVATSRAAVASCVAARALSALVFTVAVNCSIDDAVCCRLLACVSVRALRWALPEAISPAATVTESDACCTA
jgi:hypothetical protein